MTEDDDIKVNDKRRFTMDGPGDAAPAGEPGNKPGVPGSAADDKGAGADDEADTASHAHFKIGFMDLVNSLAGTALIQLGAVPDPQSNVIKKDVHAARQTIDVLELLKEKTAGNLSNDESMMLDNVLFDLRMRYVMIAEGKK